MKHYAVLDKDGVVICGHCAMTLIATSMYEEECA